MANAEDAVKILKEVGKVPELKGASITNIDRRADNTNVITIKGIWSYKNYASSQSDILSSYYTYDSKDNEIRTFPSVLQDKRIILSSVAPCSSKSAHILQDDEVSYLNIISEDHQTFSINLKDEDIHGKVYGSETSSSFCWTQDSNMLAFIAEKKRIKTSSFMSKKTESTSEGWGEKYALIDDWGEQMRDQSVSVIVAVDTQLQSLNLLSLPDGLWCGQVVWTPENTLVGVAFVTDPFRYGLIYCTNREAVLFHMDLKSNYTELIDRAKNIQSPRFSPDGSKLIFLESPSGGPHVRAAQLCLMNWIDKTITVLIDYVPKSRPIKENKLFFGLYGNSILPLRCWTEDNQHIVFSTLSNFGYATYIVNTETKEIEEVSVSTRGTLTAYDVKENYILASHSSVTEPPRIFLIRIEPSIHESQDISCDIFVQDIPRNWQESWLLNTDLGIPVPTFYFGPTDTTSGKKVPLIVWAHGGPHSIIPNRFSAAATFFVRMGFGVLFANFRGSLGQGKDSIEFLPGKCGITDVEDIYRATIDCLERFKSVLDETRVVLFGGSHGGFLVTHLSAQYPELYKVVVARNPVIDIATMVTSTDIPDWNFVESGVGFEVGKNLSGEALSKMFNMSPLSLIDKVKAPTLILLGKEDRRVPMSQGLFYHKMLLARKVKTKVFMYNDCHGLGKPDVEADSLIQAVLWFRSNI